MLVYAMSNAGCKAAGTTAYETARLLDDKARHQTGRTNEIIYG
jgi:hypothetical protein